MLRMPDLKVPPQDIEAEKSVLGSLMIDRNAMSKVADILSAVDFYPAAHQKIYEAMIGLFAKSEPIDIMSVTNALKSKKALESVGGSSYLTELINVVPSSAHIQHYAKIVREKRILRDLVSVSAEINESIFEKNSTIEQLLDQVERKIFGLSQRSQDKNYVRISEELKGAYERIERLHQGEGRLRGITTGFDELDNYLSGLQNSDLIILGARPSFGKTTLALDIARYATTRDNAPVGVFSLEMSREQVIDRLIAAEAQVPLWKLRTGRLSSELEFQLIQEALDRLSRLPMYIDDTPGLTVLQIRSIGRRLQAEHGMRLLIIDYVQLIQPLSTSENMVQQFTEISHSLKGLARELNIPVLAVSQLNRSVDQREGQIPRLSDLRETGSWEQDADVVMLLYRKDKTRLEPSLEDEGTTSVIIAKHRNGPTGTVDLKFDTEKVTFRPLEKRFAAPEI